MKITVGKLRKIIAEATEFVDKFIELPPDELRATIAAMNPDDISTADYVDNESGEIFLSVGEPASRSPLHPAYVPIKPSWGRTSYDDDEDEEDSDDDEEWELEQHDAIETEWKSALSEYASDWTDFETESDDMSAQDAAPDAAQGFFASYPDWKIWAQELDMSKSQMLAHVVDAVYEAMTANK